MRDGWDTTEPGTTNRSFAMANLFWTIVPFVLTFVIATRTPAEQPEPAPARRKSNPCLG
jgi:hypothetical protein